jgi:hypothetical protein
MTIRELALDKYDRASVSSVGDPDGHVQIAQLGIARTPCSGIQTDAHWAVTCHGCHRMADDVL